MQTVDYREVFDKAEVGIALNDPEAGTVGVVNARYAELMGYSPDELKQMKIEEISGEDPAFDQEAAMKQIQKALAGDSQRFDWLFERKDGSQFWAEVVLKRTRISEKDRLLAFVRDISERKRYEQKLQQQNQRLNEFASIVSHDLRNPLNIAEGCLELAREECDSEYLDDIEQAHERMRDLIDDLLTLAREGDSVGETDPIELEQMCQECWRGVETRRASLRVATDAMIRADRNRLQQLLENLMRNAVDHGGEGVTVRIGDLDDGFYVADDGPGIPESEREDVFEAGYSTTEEGTGFGLNIVNEIVEAHDWVIRVTDSEAGGARFEITGVEVIDE